MGRRSWSMRRRSWIRVLGLVSGVFLGVAAAPGWAGTVVRVHTALGHFDVELFDGTAPLTVENFLAYVLDGDWEDSFFHRSVPGFVIQGGGFRVVDGVIEVVPTDPPVPNEFGLSNTRGTLAMAKSEGNPDSATSQWFVNLADNSDELDDQNGGFTVFGRVLDDGMDVVDAIAALERVNAGSPFNALPVRDWLVGRTIFPDANLASIRGVEIISSLCSAGQRAAASKLCKAELSCISKYAKAPLKDPTQAALDSCRAGSSAKFVSTYQKAIASAVGKGAFCDADDPDAAAGVAQTALSTPAESLALDVLDVADLADWTSTDKGETALGSNLLKTAAGFCGSDLGLLGKYAKKPDRDKLASASPAARAKFDAAAAKTLAKADAQGVVYTGLPVAEIGDRVEALSRGFAGDPLETNSLPVLDPIGDRVGETGALVTFTATASDPDQPSQQLTFSLSVHAPAAASIDPASGVFAWTPDAAGAFEIAVIVTDGGPGPLASSETILVTVNDP